MKLATLNRGKETKYMNGYPLIESEDIYQKDHLKEGDLFHLVNAQGQFIALCYVGVQNKGLGWVLSYERDTEIDVAFFEERFNVAKDERTYFMNIEGTNAYRLFNNEGDGVGGITIDNYDGHLLIQWYSKGIYMYRDAIIAAIKRVFEYTSLYEKTRFKDESITGGFVDGDAPAFPIVIEENFTFYNVHLDDGPMTGIFLDQKDVRKKLRDYYSEDRDVLNLFSYTGAFSVIAAPHAASTTSVDLANRSRQLTEENFGLNGIDPKSQYIYVMDTFDYFQYAYRHDMYYDTIVIDPPSFARNKKKTFSVQKDYDKLIEGAVRILNEEGTLILSTNSSVYSLKAFKKDIQRTLDGLGVRHELETVMGLPKDFKSHPHYKPSKYLKVAFVHVMK